MTAQQDRYIKVGQYNTRYWVAGDHGSTVVLIHGTGQYVEYWETTVNTLAAHHQVYALDLLGQGKTDKPHEISCTFDDLGRFVKDFMTAVGLEKAHIVGHSLGGAISMNLALNYSAAVDSLVLVDSGGLGREVAMVFRLLSLPFLGEMLTRPSRSGAAMLLRLFVQDPKTITDDYIEHHFQISKLPGWQESILKTLRTGVNLWGQKDNGADIQRLPSISNPVLVIWGRQDNLVPVAHADVAARGLPDVRLKILENCGHSPPLEKAAEFNNLLLDFLND